MLPTSIKQKETLVQRAVSLPHQRVRGKHVWVWWVSGSMQSQCTKVMVSTFDFNGMSGREWAWSICASLVVLCGLALSLYVKALSKGRHGSSLIGMDGCSNERLLDQGIKVPGNILRASPDWGFPYGTGSPARHQSRPDALFVRPISGRQAHLGPSEIPPQDRDIHLVELKFCPDTNPFITHERATTQHYHTIRVTRITREKGSHHN
eukprot:1146370-Pelagomonas_calceolata.AAC.1